MLGELAARHPDLPIIYAGNRKLANAWTHHFFVAVALRDAGPEPQLALGVARRYDSAPRGVGLDERVRQAALHEMDHPFPDAPAARLRRLLDQLRTEGRIVRIGAGRGARWERVVQPS